VWRQREREGQREGGGGGRGEREEGRGGGVREMYGRGKEGRSERLQPTHLI